MSGFTVSEAQIPVSRWRRSSPMLFAARATAVSLLGTVAIWPCLQSLWTMWTTDALKSIGMVVPVVSLVLILREWRKLSWIAEGTWWGLPVLLFAIAAAQIQREALVILVVSPRWSTALPPPALVLLAYGAGVVLLLGGVRLFRAAMFPILFLWFSNPVPHAFSLLVDLPLQHLSAHIARSLAIFLGYRLTPDHLRLMFTPEFGMFIAPGCNGIRGSVTMGFIALIAGYVYRFRWYATALVVSGAMLLGYMFNLVRLCLLVLYYVVAMHVPMLQEKAEGADYVIGAILFLLASLLLFACIHWLRQTRAPQPSQPEQHVRVQHDPSGLRWKLIAIGLVAILGFAGVMEASDLEGAGDLAVITPHFPKELGSYSLARTWQETLVTGTVLYDWAEYTPNGGGVPIAIGLSSALTGDDPAYCHFVRGESPLWRGELTVTATDSDPVHLSGGFYRDGVTQYIEVSTLCRGYHCDEYATNRNHFGFIYTSMDSSFFASRTGHASVRVLVRAETLETSVAADEARQALTRQLLDFLSAFRLGSLMVH